ncbi:MAG: thiamine diphosphokinase [Clostridia bacterium]|nr:thiamine diphosphokinase [Clostridia bacterium]
MADSKKCMIIAAVPLLSGEVFKEYNPKDFVVICADAGYETAQKYNIKPDYIVGDFDSAKKRPKVKGGNVHVLPVEKDVTDTMYAAMLGLELGCRQFVIIGGVGGERNDHTFANYNVMVYIANHGGFSVMVDDSSETFLLCGKKLTITGMRGKTVSVFPFGTNTCNLTYRGLKYPLNRQDLVVGDELMGVSNEIISDNAEILVHFGCALVIVIK